MKAEAERVLLITEIVKNGLVTIMIEGHGKDLKRFFDTLIAEDIEGIYIKGPVRDAMEARRISGRSSL